jgi:hypothetical protein
LIPEDDNLRDSDWAMKIMNPDVTPYRMSSDVSVSAKKRKRKRYNKSLHDMTPNGMLLDVSALSKGKSEEKKIQLKEQLNTDVIDILHYPDAAS